MRGFFTLVSLLALASTSVFASPVDQCMDELCGGKGFSNPSPDLTDLAASIAKTETPTRSIQERGIEEMTNAERFVRGLPPKKPHHVRGSRVRRTDPSAVPLPPSITYRGIIRIDKADGSATLGYLSSHPFRAAQHCYQSMDNAMIVSFSIPADQVSGPLSELATENSDIQATFPRLSLVQGRDNTNSDLGAGSFHYVYIAGSDLTDPGVTPQTVPNSYTAATGTSRTAESGVWIFDSTTKELTVQWVNNDESKPQTTLFSQSTALYAGSDPTAFGVKYPSPIILLKYTFVPLSDITSQDNP